MRGKSLAFYATRAEIGRWLLALAAERSLHALAHVIPWPGEDSWISPASFAATLEHPGEVSLYLTNEAVWFRPSDLNRNLDNYGYFAMLHCAAIDEKYLFENWIGMGMMNNGYYAEALDIYDRFRAIAKSELKFGIKAFQLNRVYKSIAYSPGAVEEFEKGKVFKQMRTSDGPLLMPNSHSVSPPEKTSLS